MLSKTGGGGALAQNAAKNNSKSRKWLLSPSETPLQYTPVAYTPLHCTRFLFECI